MLNIISNRAIGRGIGRAAVGAGLLAASAAFGQDAEPSYPDLRTMGVINQLQFPGGTLEAFVELLQAEVDPIPMNVRFRNGAEFAEISSVHLRNVHVGTALQSAIFGSSLDFAMIAGEFGSNVYVITGEAKIDSGVDVVVERATEIITIGDLFAQGSTQLTDVLEAIDVAVHDETQTKPTWRRPEIRFHEPSGLMIVQGTPSQVATIAEVVNRMTDASTDRRMQYLQQASDRIRLEADMAELQVQMSVAMDQQEMAQLQLREAKNRHETGVLSSVEVHQQELAVTMTRAELSIVRARLHAAEEQLDLFKQAESIETSSRVYEFGSISGAGDELRSVLAAIGKLSGPEIKAKQTENELKVIAAGAQHAVIAAVIEAMKAAASQDPH